jgi:hypothetical protein
MRKSAGVRLLADVQAHWPLVKKVVDAKEQSTFTFAIDSIDCQKGAPETPGFCPTALALARTTQKHALCRRWVTILIDPKSWIAVRYMNDPPLARMIANFDHSAKYGKAAVFTPGVYTIRKPGTRQKLGRRPPRATMHPGSHPHKGPRGPLRQTWANPTPNIGPVVSEFSKK